MEQLVMMKHSSVFINDAAEAGRLIKEMPSKGSIYGAFRYAVTVPDMLGESSLRQQLSHKLISAGDLFNISMRLVNVQFLSLKKVFIDVVHSCTV